MPKIKKRPSKLRKKKLQRPQSVQELELPVEEVEQLVEDDGKAVRGPLGNYDYIPHGSPAHAALLGFTNEDLTEIMFDTVGLPQVIVDRFVSTRQRMLQAGLPTAPPGCPPPWGPTSDDNITEVR